MYNFALAFMICSLAFVIGEYVSTITKAWVPSVFVTAAVFLVGYWTVIPRDVVTDSGLLPWGRSLAVFLMIVNVGTLISLKNLIEQWKTIVICLIGLVGMCAACLTICPMFMDKSMVVAGLPPLTGGIVAASMMQKAAEANGMQTAAVFAIAMYCMQGFAGYPLTAICLQKEGRRLLSNYRSGITENNVLAKDANVEETVARKKLIPPVPAKYDSAVLVLGKLALVSWLSILLGSKTGISGAIWGLVLSVILCTIGFLDTDSLGKAKSYGIVMFALMMYIFDGLKDCTPEMLQSIIGPMIILIVIGVIGMAVLAFVASKILKVTFFMGYATCLTALYGFPCNAIITESTCNALGTTQEEVDYLRSQMLPSMIVGGFTTVTITSVVIAGVFEKML